MSGNLAEGTLFTDQTTYNSLSLHPLSDTHTRRPGRILCVSYVSVMSSTE